MVPNTIEAVLRSSKEERSRQLSIRPEDQWFDRKSIAIQPKDLAKTLVGMANAEGGTVAVGIHEGKIQNLGKHPSEVNRLRKVVNGEFIETPFSCRIEEIETVSSEGEDTYTLLFQIPPSSKVSRTTDGYCYLRSGDSTNRLKPSQERELEYERGVSTFEAEPLDESLDYLNESYIKDFLQASGSTRGAEHLLKSRGLLLNDGRVTRAAHLLFADFPAAVIPGCHIRVLRYHGNERLTGERQNILFDQRTDLPIPQAVNQALEWIREQIPRRKALGDGAVFEQVPLAPEGAWKEAVVNAAIHRSYSFTGDHIRVEIFDNRMEIINPGNLHGLTSGERKTLRKPDALGIIRYVRNPRIARTMTELGYSQELGEGIKRIFDEMVIAGLSDPIYEQPPMHVKLTLPFVLRMSETERKNLPRKTENILAALRSLGGRGGTSEIAEQAHISIPTTRKTLQRLEVAGLVSWEGHSPRDPRATWNMVAK